MGVCEVYFWTALAAGSDARYRRRVLEGVMYLVGDCHAKFGCPFHHAWRLWQCLIFRSRDIDR